MGITVISAVCLSFVLAFLLSVRADAAEAEKEELRDYMAIVCQERNICPELVEAVIERESNWNTKAENGDCIGLMQISKRWHQERMDKLGVTDLTDPYGNILVGVDYLADLFERHIDVGKVLMVYNGDSRAWEYDYTGDMSEYAEWILTRSAELERSHGK